MGILTDSLKHICAPMLAMLHNVWVNHRLHSYIILITFAVFILSGCNNLVDYGAIQDNNSDIVTTLVSGHTAGQTFTPHRNCINSITIWVSNPNQYQAATLRASLYENAATTSPIYSQSFLIDPNSQNTPVLISIPAQVGSSEISYYLEIASDQSNISLHGRAENIYSNGHAYNERAPIEGDLAFRLSYCYTFLSLEADLLSWFSQVKVFISIALIIFVPGWLLLDLLGLRDRFTFAEQISLSTGISLAAIPLLMLWTSQLDLPWSSQSVRFATMALASLALIRGLQSVNIGRRHSINRHKITQTAPFKFFHNEPAYSRTDIALIFICLLGLAIRLIIIRDLATPPWVDSIHHGFITRQIVGNGGFPQTYQPALNIETTDYHLGFHSTLATLIWLTDLPIPHAMLLFGQVLNSLAILGAYVLTNKIFNNPIAGIIAAWITAFLTVMPTYLTTWGRYTHLAGLIILPCLFVLLVNAQKRSSALPHLHYRSVILATITAAGLFLTHYRVLAFSMCLIVSFALSQLCPCKVSNRIRLLKFFKMTIATAFLTILITLPWIIPLVRQTIIPWLAPATELIDRPFADFSWRFLTAAAGNVSLVFAGIGVAWALLRKPRPAITLLGWVLLMFLLANLDALHLPGGMFVNDTAVVITLFLPISAAGGYLLAELYFAWKTLLPKHLHFLAQLAIVLVLTIGGYGGARQLLTILHPATIITRPTDLQTIQIADNQIPPGETVLINPFPWGYGLYAGYDGGYWLPAITDLYTIPPPVLYGMGSTTSIERINQICQQVIENSKEPEAIWEIMGQNDIHYIFIGARGGVLSPTQLDASPLFSTLYAKDDTWIFQSVPNNSGMDSNLIKIGNHLAKR